MVYETYFKLVFTPSLNIFHNPSLRGLYVSNNNVEKSLEILRGEYLKLKHEVSELRKSVSRMERLLDNITKFDTEYLYLRLKNYVNLYVNMTLRGGVSYHDSKEDVK